MEYCKDGTLLDLMRKKVNFTEEEIFDIFYQLMKGYRVLWERKILHQDLKPENVLIKENKLKLTDFGFSILYEGHKYSNVREGTVHYMPLEKLTEK
jgi:aurora kinase